MQFFQFGRIQNLLLGKEINLLLPGHGELVFIDKKKPKHNYAQLKHDIIPLHDNVHMIMSLLQVLKYEMNTCISQAYQNEVFTTQS